MNKERIIRLLEEQLGFAREQNRQLSEQLSGQSELISRQSEQLSKQSEQINSLTLTIQALEKALLENGLWLEKEKAGKKAIAKLLKNQSEKITHKPQEQEESSATAAAKVKTAPSPRERGNNNARRKDHCYLETVEHDIHPEAEGFDPQASKPIKTEKAIRYEYIPPRFVKHIYRRHYYVYRDTVIYGELPATPLLNSAYDASFIAGILQLRYIYSLPVERIIKLFHENGFELNKSTAHGLIKKAAGMFDSLDAILKEAVLEDSYIHMDETHYTVLDAQAKSGKGSRKVYFWSALADTLKLSYFFYNNGSRGGRMVEEFLPKDYRGAVQTDGYAVYKPLQTDAYPNLFRLGCFQHCKRKFLDIGNNPDARQVVDIINQLYKEEHLLPTDTPVKERQKHRQKYIPPILEELEKKLLEIKDRKTTLPKSSIGKAVYYALNQLPAMSNYILDGRYQPDNNAIERINRYISLSRRNSLFCGSHQGAKRAALIYSLACSCRLHKINTFEYFKDLLEKLILTNPNTSKKELRALLPDKWKDYNK